MALISYPKRFSRNCLNYNDLAYRIAYGNKQVLFKFFFIFKIKIIAKNTEKIIKVLSSVKFLSI